jgi:hypothetical protein
MEPKVMTQDQIRALAGKIEEVVRQECPQDQYCEGPGEALMLAAHNLMGWRVLRDLTR